MTAAVTEHAAPRGRGALLARQAGAGIGEAVLAGLVALVVTAVGLTAFSMVDWPAFNSSNVTRALTTVGQVFAAALLIAAIALTRRAGTLPGWLGAPWLAKALSWVGISTFVTFTLGMPLAATKLYLFGVSVDQEFRTEFLTRLTDSPVPHDMTYVNLPPFYPSGWFWIGGRVADVLGMAGWEAFKPYAIGSIAVAAVISLVLWSKLIRADWAIAVTAAVTAIVLAYASPEAYSAVIVLLLPPALILAWGALHRPADGKAGTAGGWGAVLGTGLFLGLGATFYTLYFLLAAFAVALMGLLAAGLAVRERRAADRRAGADRPPAWRAALAPLVRLVAIAVIAGVLAAIVWAPYLLKTLSSPTASTGTAQHYLPESGAELFFPMVEFSLRGALCLIGVIWLVLRAGSSRRAQALGMGVVAVYLWTLLSMTATVAKTTLLSFRLEPILLALLAAAGAFGVVEGTRAIYQALNEPGRFRLMVTVVTVAAALAFTQDIPHVLDPEITTAYTDTDGNGQRGDQRNPSPVAHYGEVDKALLAQTGRPRSDTVVLTADTSFLAFYPYYGFQALTPHYANPLADFQGRAAAIKQWSTLKSSSALLDALAASPWRAPDAFLFRNGGDSYALKLAEDVYPNDPNVKRYPVTFPKALFADPRFTTTEIGPFALVTIRR
ncbi:arabinofuranosyltransferase [Nocardia altamirensis]|uniref:arabinofuranosyltransferase n=1 Tax=Nocardia altamirensis TaxID=472158 RepID=UPI0009FF4390|nr:arabinofuranosyltransferase [Nocardia altamirensis]